MLSAEKVESPHTISIVVPVYRGEKTLDSLVAEITPLTNGVRTPAGTPLRVSEVILVHDNGPDLSDQAIGRLAKENAFVRPVWLSRNFGQHAATIAGISSTGSEWIVTLDEDGQFDPNDIGKLLDVALRERAQLVYGTSMNAPPHGVLRNFCSTAAKSIATHLLTDGGPSTFTSFRLMLGEIGRGVSAYVGPGVYLDVALSWTFGRIGYCPVQFREEGVRPSGYTLKKLLGHFWQLVVSSGPRPLRLVSLGGIIAAFAGVILAVVVFVERISGGIKVAGWTSLAVIVLVLGGLTLLALGIVAEYVGAAVRMAMGKPLYLITSDPTTGPLHRLEPRRARPKA